jgi:uncharacterized membrane protein YbjE (DUF340 family)
MTIIGIAIGFYGYLFPGNINLMVVELYSKRKYRLLWVVLAMIALFESLYCGLSLWFLNSIKNDVHFYKTVELISFVLILLMGIWMIADKRYDKKATHQSTIARGIISMIIHPQQIPFWVIAGVLINKIVDLYNNSYSLWLFVLFNAIGALLAMFAYMIFGNKLLQYFRLNISQVNRAMGVVYILLALWNLLSF